MRQHFLALLGIGLALAACGEGDRAGIHGPWAHERLQTWVSPVLAGDRVWAVVTHELGYEQVVRFRLEPLPGS